MMRGNLHTHSTYCDGKSTMEEMVASAISKGFTYIGFSGHGYTDIDTNYCMSLENEKRYFEEIEILREKYGKKIKILCGIERDFYSQTKYSIDYEIASCHYIKAGECYYDVDESAQKQKYCIDAFYGGDPYAYAEEYYKSVAQLSGDIVGHFDLITKFDREGKIFTPEEERYKKAALNALSELLEKNIVFEVNTGAMARGYKDAPYPDRWLLEEIKRQGGRVIITSDCHDAKNLDYGYEETEKLLLEIGFKDFYDISFL